MARPQEEPPAGGGSAAGSKGGGAGSRARRKARRSIREPLPRTSPRGKSRGSAALRTAPGSLYSLPARDLGSEGLGAGDAGRSCGEPGWRGRGLSGSGAQREQLNFGVLEPPLSPRGSLHGCSRHIAAPRPAAPLPARTGTREEKLEEGSLASPCRMTENTSRCPSPRLSSANGVGEREPRNKNDAAQIPSSTCCFPRNSVPLGARRAPVPE